MQYLIFTIPMVLSVITGFLSLFILVPRGLVHRDSCAQEWLLDLLSWAYGRHSMLRAQHRP
jgi:hypothetical protein